MTANNTFKEEIWTEAASENVKLQEHLEAMHALFQKTPEEDKELLEITKELIAFQVPFTTHLFFIQEKGKQGIPVPHRDWVNAEEMALTIASKLLFLDNAIEQYTPAGEILQTAARHFAKFTDIFQELRGAPNLRKAP